MSATVTQEAKEVTFHGLEAWKHKLFEKFGGVVICDKPNTLNDFVGHLDMWLAAAKRAHTELSEADRKRDILIMAKHVEKLKAKAEHLLKCKEVVDTTPMAMAGGRRKGSKKGSKKKGSKRHSKKK